MTILIFKLATDAYTDVGGRERLEQVLENTENTEQVNTQLSFPHPSGHKLRRGSSRIKAAISGTLFHWTSVAYMDVGKGREHDHMDVGDRTNQDEYRTYSGENVWNIFSSGSLPPCGVYRMRGACTPQGGIEKNPWGASPV